VVILQQQVIILPCKPYCSLYEIDFQCWFVFVPYSMMIIAENVVGGSGDDLTVWIDFVKRFVFSSLVQHILIPRGDGDE